MTLRQDLCFFAAFLEGGRVGAYVDVQKLEGKLDGNCTNLVATAACSVAMSQFIVLGLAVAGLI